MSAYSWGGGSRPKRTFPFLSLIMTLSMNAEKLLPHGPNNCPLCETIIVTLRNQFGHYNVNRLQNFITVFWDCYKYQVIEIAPLPHTFNQPYSPYGNEQFKKKKYKLDSLGDMSP